MSQRLILDHSSFERLLAAALVLQRQHEREARNGQPAPDETPSAPPQTDGEPHCVSEPDPISERLMAALGKLSHAAEAVGNKDAALGSAGMFDGIEQFILPLKIQAGNQEPAPRGSSLTLLTRDGATWSEPTSANGDTSPYRLLADSPEHTRTAEQMIATRTAAGQDAAAPEGKEISSIKRESFRTARQRSVSWPVVRANWELVTESVGHGVRPAFQALRRPHSFWSTAISAARFRQNLRAEAQSLWLRACRRVCQEFRGATKDTLQCGLRKGSLGHPFRHTPRWLLDVVDGAKSIPANFARYRAKTWVTFDSKFTLSPRRAMVKAGTPLLVLLIIVAFTLLQVWPREHLHTVAAMSRMNHPSEENRLRASEQVRPTPPVQVSHMQVTDPVVSSVVEALSRYEIPGLRHQADDGDDSAAFTLGMIYETGHLVPQSCTKAAAWVTASASAGNAAAQYNLGLRYREGDGLPVDEYEAEKWLRKATDQRYSNATQALETVSKRGQ